MDPGIRSLWGDVLWLLLQSQISFNEGSFKGQLGALFNLKMQYWKVLAQNLFATYSLLIEGWWIR